MRSGDIDGGRYKIINDAKRSPANKAAFEFYGTGPQRRSIAVLGDMLELGVRHGRHREVGETAENKVSLHCFVGELSEKKVEGAVKAGFSPGRSLSCKDCDSAVNTRKACSRR